MYSTYSHGLVPSVPWEMGFSHLALAMRSSSFSQSNLSRLFACCSNANNKQQDFSGGLNPAFVVCPPQLCNKIVFLVSFVGNRGTFTRGYRAVIMDMAFLYHVAYVLVCMLGLCVHEFFYSFLVSMCFCGGENFAKIENTVTHAAGVNFFLTIKPNSVFLACCCAAAPQKLLFSLKPVSVTYFICFRVESLLISFQTIIIQLTPFSCPSPAYVYSVYIVPISSVSRNPFGTGVVHWCVHHTYTKGSHSSVHLATLITTTTNFIYIYI